MMDISHQPLVSVLTPVHNGASYLVECIESVLRQTYQNYEYIIVNNCSTDGTLEIAKQYAATDVRIRVYTNNKFVGVIDNHNIAFSQMSPSARYCKLVSADDVIFPRCIEQMVLLAEANPQVGVVGSYQLSGDIVRWQGFSYPHAVVAGREIGRRCILGSQVLWKGKSLVGFGSPTSLLYRADLVRNNPPFYPNPSPHADTSACFRILQTSEFGFVYEVLSYERTHAESQTSTCREVNTYASQRLSDLIEYGASYLSSIELEQQVKETLKYYHRFLAVKYCVGFRNSEFWEYHKSRLHELGYPLTRGALLKAAALTVLEEGVNPALALKKLQKYRTGRRSTDAAANAKTRVAVDNGLAKC
jgi:glycosyltransferase involved in cell wall biosynthesis